MRSLDRVEPSILLVGDVDYGPLEPADGERDTARAAFDRLPFTADEVSKIAAEFEASLDAEPRHRKLLTRREATKEAFVEYAVGRRYLHVATHGWIAPDGDDAGGVATLSLAPLARCGIALAGAEGGRGPDGRRPGILTAEHLAGLDLRECELAVLSACRTNVGLRTGGQSVQSLQTALHSAGVRNAVTSLWHVPDSLTEELMVRFYRNLWRERMTPRQALWAAKTWLREEHGAQVRHWAAWVLTSQ
jgi:CHAT domain-containing protein